MECDDKKNGTDRSAKPQFRGHETIETIDNFRAPTERLNLDEGMTAFLRTIIRTEVLSAAVKRLESRNLSEQILERRIRTLAGLTADYVTGTDFSRLSDEDSGNPLSEDALLKQFLDLTGDLRGGFGVLEEAAARLGKDWETDRRNFVDITIGMSRLQLLMRKLVNRWTGNQGTVQHGNALVAVAAGEEHTFGQCMLEEILRAHGWSTVLFNPQQTGGFLNAVRKHEAHLVCFSWISPHLQPLVDADLSTMSLQPLESRPIVIAGGHAALEKQKWMVSHGVDRICTSAYAALKIASQITDSLQKNPLPSSTGTQSTHAVMGRG
ncbi:MAG: cobalamin-dependent protein [Pseudomonadota bacterium]